MSSDMTDVGMDPNDFSIKFWNIVASYFKDVTNIIFEINNEPASISGEVWKKYANIQSIQSGKQELIN